MADYNSLGIAFGSYEAAATIGINRLVCVDASNKIRVTSAITDNVIGVATQSGSAGDMVTVQHYGKAKCVVSGTVALADGGTELMPTASGAGKCSLAAGATAKSFGIVAPGASTATLADGDVIEVLLFGPVGKGPANS